MEGIGIRFVVRRAELELRQILRRHTQDRHPQVIVDLLERERFGMIRTLGEFTPEEKEWIEKYMYAYVWLGRPEGAYKLSKLTGVSVNWSNEKGLVERGYRAIAQGSVLRWGEYRELVPSNVAQLQQMRELTGIRIPEDVHSYLVNEAFAHSPNYTFRQLKRYLMHQVPALLRMMLMNYI